jgi:AcrR family transcriptional regulator
MSRDRLATKEPYVANTDQPDVREQLVRGALRLIAAEGTSDLGVRRLAQAGDRTTMCVYTKFGSRQGLLAAVYERAGDQLLEQLDGARTPAQFAERYRRAVTDRPGLYELLFEQPLPAMGLEPDTRAALVDRVTRCLARLLEPVNPERAHERAQTMWATLHGLTVLSRTSPGRSWKARFQAAADQLATR